ncbi:hypothetical protein [Micromonospora craniellae]|nr:hypothetical protein [Micromonospora craniellae]
MRVRSASAPPPGRAVNEDLVFRFGPLVGVLDGATVPEGFDTGCVHGPQWYVRHLAARLGLAEHGYWVAAADPDAAYQAVVGTLPLRGPEALRRAVLLTDGASVAVEEFGLLDWADLLDVVSAGGPGALVDLVRAAERDHPDRPRRHKPADDASAVYCEFTRSDDSGA